MNAPSASDGTFDLDRLTWRRLRRKRRDAVTALRRSALDAPDLETVLTEALHVATKVLDVELAKVLQHDPARDTLAVRAANGWPTNVAGRVIEHARDTSQAGYALRTGHAMVIEDLRRVDAFRTTKLLRENDVVSGATVIVHGQSAPWGVLSVHSRQRRMLTPDDLDFLQAVADVIAAAAYRFVLVRRRAGLSALDERRLPLPFRH